MKNIKSLLTACVLALLIATSASAGIMISGGGSDPLPVCSEDHPEITECTPPPPPNMADTIMIELLRAVMDIF